MDYHTQFRTHIYAYRMLTANYIFVMNKLLTSDSATSLGLGFDLDSKLTQSTFCVCVALLFVWKIIIANI